MDRVGAPADLQSQHLQDWDESSKRVMRSYKAWCAARRQDRHEEYLCFLNALGREQQAARQVESDSHSTVGADSQPVE